MTLEEKIHDVLARLSLLSEAPTSNLDPTKSHHAPGSSAPPGVAERRNLHLEPSGRPPDKRRDLHGWWCWRFAQAFADGECEFDLHRLYLLAERDYGERVYHSPDRMALRSGGLTDNDAVDGGAAERAAAERVVELYEGVPAAEVAVHEYATEVWVKKARRMHGRQPHDGRPRPEFLDWDEDRRKREVAALAESMGQKAAAKRLGVDRNTVKRYWPERELAAA